MGDAEDAGIFDLEIEWAHWSNNICIQYSTDMSEESSRKFFALLGYRVVSPGRRGRNLAKSILASLLLSECVVCWPVAAKVQKFSINETIKHKNTTSYKF